MAVLGVSSSGTGSFFFAQGANRRELGPEASLHSGNEEHDGFRRFRHQLGCSDRTHLLSSQVPHVNPFTITASKLNG